MDFAQVRIFLTVAEELHFGRAAERLHMAQPPVSRAIAQLEHSLATKLFERSTRRVELTPAGRAFVHAAEQIVRAVHHAHDTIRWAQSGDAGAVSIVFAGISSHGQVWALSRELRRAHPNIVADYQSGVFALQALERVTRGEADIALGRWDFVPAELESTVVSRERLVVVLPASHPLAGAASVSFEELRDESFVELADPSSVLHDRLLRLARAAGYEPRVTQLAPDTWTVLTFVAAELGVALTLDSVDREVHHDHISFVPVRGDADVVELRMAWLRSNANPALTHVLRAADAAWGQERTPGASLPTTIPINTTQE